MWPHEDHQRCLIASCQYSTKGTGGLINIDQISPWTSGRCVAGGQSSLLVPETEREFAICKYSPVLHLVAGEGLGMFGAIFNATFS
jgi:hypothetical protein